MTEIAEISREQFARSYAQYREWKTVWLAPVSRAVNEQRFGDARALLELARQERATGELREDVREALGYALLFMHCRSNWPSESFDYTQQDYDGMLENFRKPALSKLGEQTRRVYLVYIRINGSADGYDTLGRDEIDELLSPLPDRLAAPAWQQLARWAFDHADNEILERAYEFFLECPGNSMGQARWLRVSLMHRLVSGKATRRDVHDYMQHIVLRPQMREFQNQLWEKCRDQGLVDRELEELLEERDRAIAGQA